MVGMSFASLVGRRVVLVCKNQLVFAGRLKGLFTMDGPESVVLELDPESGFSVLCPTQFVDSLRLVPITETGSRDVP